MSQAISIKVDSDGVAFLAINIPDNEMNALNTSLIEEFLSTCDQLKQNTDVKACIIHSGKSDVFVAGADITAIQKAETSKDGETLAGAAQKAFNTIQNLKVPTVAAVNGPALGGGYELALSCDAIIASDNPKTKLGLPEVMLGVLPGGGGTQRLPQRIGLVKALDPLLTGRQYSAKQAKRLGMIDELVPNSILLASAKNTALSLSKATVDAQPTFKRFFKPAFIQSALLEKNRFGRQLVMKKARQKVMAQTGGNYPAPLAILDCIETGQEYGQSLGFDRERVLFGKLAISKECKQLVNIFFKNNELKKQRFGVDNDSTTVEKMNIIGGGTMGGGIAAVSIDKTNALVRIKDISDDGIRHALSHCRKYFDQKVKRRSLSANDAKQKMARLSSSLDYSGFADSNLVIEAAYEDLDVKHQILADVEKHANKQTVFASNTSSLRIEDIAKKAQRPENVVGMHYFSPVEKMPLLEIIRHKTSSDQAVSTAVNYGRKQGKTAVVVQDGPGFFVNRILGPYANEAAHLLQEGNRIEDIDKYLKAWGFPVGPFKLLDEVGIDVCAKVQGNLEAGFGERMKDPGALDTMLKDGRKGKKVAKGFYLYTKKQSKQEDPAIYDLFNITVKENSNKQSIIDRCTLMMLNEAALCLEDGTIASPSDGDLACIYGIGFPPFRGGPFRYMDTIGVENVAEQMSQLASEFGARFQPAPLLQKMAKSSECFYPTD